MSDRALVLLAVVESCWGELQWRRWQGRTELVHMHESFVGGGLVRGCLHCYGSSGLGIYST